MCGTYNSQCKQTPVVIQFISSGQNSSFPIATTQENLKDHRLLATIPSSVRECQNVFLDLKCAKHFINSTKLCKTLPSH